MFFKKKPKRAPEPAALKTFLGNGDIAGYTAAQVDHTERLRSGLREKGEVGPLFLTCQPKSASKTIRKRMMDTFEIPHTQTWDGVFPEIVLSRRKMHEFRAQSGITQGHIPLTPVNRKVLELYTPKVLCQIRDPRAAVYSLMWMMERYRKSQIDNLMYFGLPDNYYDLDMPERLDFFIQNHYGHHVEFIQKWAGGLDDPSFGVDVLILTYEEFVKDARLYFEKVASFFGFDQAHVDSLVEGENANFRSGDPNEWMAHFSPQQMRDMEALSPPALMSRFGWTG